MVFGDETGMRWESAGGIIGCIIGILLVFYWYIGGFGGIAIWGVE